MKHLPQQSQYPKNIFIGSESYRVKFTKKIKHFGETDPVKHEIRIKYGMSRRETFMTLIHELLHAVAFEGNYKLRHKTVYRLEKSLAELLLDNFI